MVYLHRAISYKFFILICRFLRSVSYRQFTRLLWDYLGNSKRYPLPCCAYNAIRKAFPSDDGRYRGFEEEEVEEEEGEGEDDEH